MSRSFDELRDDKDYVLERFKADDFEYKWLSKRLRDDKELALLFISKNAGCFEMASERLRDDKDVALLAVKNSWHEFDSVSDRLNSDRDVVIAACENLISDKISESDFYYFLSLLPEAHRYEKDVLNILKNNLLNDEFFKIAEYFDDGVLFIKAREALLKYDREEELIGKLEEVKPTTSLKPERKKI